MDPVLPRYAVMDYLWLLLPVLSAALGVVLGRGLPGTRTLAVRGAPVCVLLGMAGALVWWNDLIWAGASYGLSPLLGGILLLMLAALAAGGAVLCAFRPTRASCGVIALGAVLCLAYTAHGLTWNHISSYGQPSTRLLVMIILDIATAVLAFVGLFGKETAPAKAPAPQQAPSAPPQPVASAGCLTILLGSFAGQQVPLPAGEELLLGSDAAQCHLILDVEGMPSCLCAVRWLEGRDTYLVSCRAPESLIWADGSRAPSGSTTEVFPGTVCYLPATGIPVVQLG